MKPVLILQPAFLGDVVLTLPLVKVLHEHGLHPIHFLARRGTESLLAHVPQIDYLHTWDKSSFSLWKLYKILRKTRWHAIINLHRHFRMGLFGLVLPAKIRMTFAKNPLSLFYTHRAKHRFDGTHEVQRNLQFAHYLGFYDNTLSPPWVEVKPTCKVEELQKFQPYWVIAPGSQWNTKKLPKSTWQQIIEARPVSTLYVVGSAQEGQEWAFLETLPGVKVLMGELDLVEVMALMQKAQWVFTMDSGAAHLASAVNANHIQIYVSTVPEFGFYSLSGHRQILEPGALPCRPCGIHGHKACPLGHFACGHAYTAEKLLQATQ
ncbi:MAG: glycosyltransferase family 9 protein [Bacteroidia bacterium]